MSTSEKDFELTTEQVENIRQIFIQYDDTGDGEIPVDKLKDVIRGLGHNIKPNELKELIQEVDEDGSGTVDFEEFLPLMKQKMQEKQEEEFYKDMFRMLDKKAKGYILIDDLRFILEGLKDEVDLTSEEIDQMIIDVDEDGNGEVSFDEFKTMMTSE